jgi:hypothetical protein
MIRCKECAVGLLGACSLDYCQTEREALIEQARQASEAYGHVLTGFAKVKDYPIWQATCELCGQMAAINLDPPAGQPDVYGEAVASACPDADMPEPAATAGQEAPDPAPWYDELTSSETEAT